MQPIPENLTAPDNRMTASKIQTAYQLLVNRFARFRTEQLRDYRYSIGDQLSPEVTNLLNAEHRPALIFNLIQPLLLYMAGELASNKQSMKAVPLRFGDELSAELHTVLVSDFAMAGCDAEEEFVKASVDALIAKIGWMANYWSTKKNPEGEWITESFDPMMVMWDPDGRKEDQSDWRYMTVSAFYGAEEIIQIYGNKITPDMAYKIRKQANILEGAWRQLNVPTGWLDRIVGDGRELFQTIRGSERIRDTHGGLINSFLDARNGIYRVIEWHERRALIRNWLYNPETRDSKQIGDDEAAHPEALLSAYPGTKIQPIIEEQLWQIVCAPGLLPDDIIFEKPYPIQQKGFSLKPIFCYSLHPDTLQTASLVDNLISASDSFNQRRMTLLEYIMDTVNPKIDAPITSIPPDQMDSWKSKERGTIRFYMPTAGGLKPEASRPQVDKQALQMFAEEDRDLIQKLSSISPNQQGYRESSNEAASLYRQRVEQGQTVMSYFNSHIKRCMANVFGYCDRGLQTFMTMPRMVRLLSEPPAGLPGVQKISQGEQDIYWLQLNWPTMQGIINDIHQGEYDFKADTQKLGATARRAQFLEVIEFLKLQPGELIPWHLVWKLYDSPISDEARAYVEMKLGIADQNDQLKQTSAKLQVASQAKQLMAPQPQPASQ